MGDLDLYKFLQSRNVMSYRVDEFMNEKDYLIWIYFHGVEEFVRIMKEAGTDFSELYNVILQDECIVVNLTELCLDDIDLEKVFKKGDER